MPLKTISALALILLIGVPFSASAATKKPTCAITVTTENGVEKFTKSGDFYVAEDEEFEIAWTSKNATKAVDGDRDPIALSGSENVSIDEKTEYSYTFSSGSKKVTCEVTAIVAEGTIDSSSLTTSSTKPTITGTATGAKKVWITLTDDDTDIVYKSKEKRVSKGKWKIKLPKAIAKGTYDVQLYGEKKVDLNKLATGTLTVGTTSSSSGSSNTSSGTSASTLSVSAIPLLSGGFGRANASVPVTYLKVVNTGTETATLNGIWLKQNGSASNSVVTGFSTSDDKGGSRSTVAANFNSSNKVFVPLVATILPGQLRIFTLKAQLATSVATSVGTTLMLDVDSIDTNSKKAGMFPVRGTTWTLSY